MSLEGKRSPQVPLGEDKLRLIRRLGQPDASDPRLVEISNLVDELSPEARDFLGFLTSSFLELDEAKKTLGNPNARDRITNHFTELGLAPDKAKRLVDYFVDSGFGGKHVSGVKDTPK